eukprot:COSAG06_NODE_3536_length_5216_cov_128.882548_1_plen_38_part_10
MDPVMITEMRAATSQREASDGQEATTRAHEAARIAKSR